MMVAAATCVINLHVPRALAGDLVQVFYTTNAVVRTVEPMVDETRVTEAVRATPYSFVADFQSGETYSFTVLAPQSALFSFDPGTSTPDSISMSVECYFTENGSIGGGLVEGPTPDKVEFIGASANAPALINQLFNHRTDGTAFWTKADAESLTQAFTFEGFRFTGSAKFGSAGSMTYYQLLVGANIRLSARFTGDTPAHEFLAVTGGPVINSIRGNGTISYSGVATGTAATIEWAASLTEPGRTNWHKLSSCLVTQPVTTNDIPMFFRVRGFPAP